ncbi:MAG: hypothetical protein Q7T74_04355 [Candidatus Saccharibacteria bacterium]|nr:hypothetical protein [Candidatus Saccharibacteria bacterium]
MSKGKTTINQNGAAGGAYFIAYFGALIYFINQAHGFWEVVLAFLQSLVWPAYLVYHIFVVLRI